MGGISGPGLPANSLAVIAIPGDPAYRAGMARTAFFESAIFKLLVFLLGTVVLASVLAPPLYWGGKHAVAEGWLEGGWLEGLHGSLERARFSRYFNRAVLVSALILIGPTLRWMRKGSPGGAPGGTSPRRPLPESLGLEPNPAWWKHLAIGFATAGGTLLLLGWFYVSRGWYEQRDAAESVAGILLQALGTGFAVAFLEEFVFRGALQALLAKVLRPRVLFFVVAVFFAVIHFFQAPRKLEVEEVTLATGFWFVGRIFGHFFSLFAQPDFLLAEFAVLFAIGLVLGYTRMKTRSLWLGIGLHAGWVFGVKTLSPLTVRAFKRDAMMPWLGDTLRVGAVSCLVVALTGLAIWLWLRRNPRDPFAEEVAE